ncbi:MAG: DNA-directed RNA polymerase subunit A' [Candidatus Aenigmarchaeota archaeon]|nr:DNA-directed RNA polymerase subunit A' [Candidatus Aenigmarchaeota archaeon]
MADIFLDGKYLGRTNDPKKIVEEFRKLRREGKIPHTVNIAYYEHLNEVRILTSPGRIIRPLIVVENGKPKLTEEILEKVRKGELTFSDLVKNGIIEFLDAEEEENSYIASRPEELTKEHTHLEIDPAVIFGFSASFVPYPEFNRGDRVNYGSKMNDQAIGIPVQNFLNRVDSKLNILLYPQKPLVQTYINKITKADEYPHGFNVVIAVTTFEGYNIEDGVVINRASVERGMFWSYMYRTYEAEEKIYMGGQQDVIGVPQPGVRGYAGEDEYKHLPEDGIINSETNVNSDQVLIGRVSPLRFLGKMEKIFLSGENLRESSVRLRHGDKGIVDRVYITQTTDGTKLVKVVVRDLKKPEVGDKFASRHGQKGVMGILASPEDMPFTESGIIPDIIFNPHGLPSRMTVGQLLEILAGKVASLSGRIIDAPAFNPTKEDELKAVLKKLGFRESGKEVMYDGRTGRKFTVEIFVGCAYYMRLDHLVSNKIQVRARGPVTLLTRQPTEGRSKEGGLRLGEMEKDCLLAHGAVLTLKERFDSDKIVLPICKECGMVAVHDRVKNRYFCPIDGDKADIASVEMSYAFKLMLDELKSMLIYPKIRVDEEGKVNKIEFSILDPETIRKMSFAKITKIDIYDEEGYPIEGGIMDPRLGTIEPGIRCRVCGGNIGECTGHFGYLELIKPVIHPHYSKFIHFLLQITCRKCSRILIDKEKLEELKKNKVSWGEISKIITKKCPHCKTEQKEIKFVKPYTFVEGSKTLNSIEIRERLEKMIEDDLKILGIKIRPEWLIITVLPIPPVTVRPSITLETGERSEDDLTHKLVEIVRINDRFRENIELGAPEFLLNDLWELLQYHVATYIDNELTGIPPARHRSGRVLKALTQRLKTKEGRFRGNLLGKRVNFSARTVISPDPRIGVDEVGVPLVVAKELTIPVRVTEKNIEELRRYVLNGPDVWPGANYIIKLDGRRKKILESNKEEVAKELEVGYIVERHLIDGDIAIFNRQPSLHRMSMMAHRVKVMPHQTFRLNVAVCTPYNADFDGDEMNLHAVQTAEARAEIEFLAAVEKNIRSPRYSSPIIGPIRDEITGLYMLTKDDTRLKREDVVKLIRSVDLNVEIPDKEVFTGKEVFSLLLPKDFSIEYKGKIGSVKIVNGQLVEGTLDKNGISADGGKIINKIEKDYGKSFAKEFIYKVGILGINYLDMFGLTFGIDELDIDVSYKEEIKKIILKAEKDVNELIEKYKKGELTILIGRAGEEFLENVIKERIAKCVNEVTAVFEKAIKPSQVLDMIKCGARGGMVNLLQIGALIGQEMVMGRRIERGYYRRTFPHFKMDDKSLASKGFVGRGYKDGLNVFEFFFDNMNSRESLMDKSLKTRHSGYMERRLVGALQDLKVAYDGTIRDAMNRVIQFIPGEDGLDTSKIVREGINVREIARRILNAS